MSGTSLFDDAPTFSGEKSIEKNYVKDFPFKLPFSNKCVNESCQEQEPNGDLDRSSGKWCDALSASLPGVSAKQAWKNGTEKLTQTFNNVRTTFGVLSQRIKKSTRKRQPLVNIDSPRSPVTPYTTSKAVLGRTPTKLYSPFSIDTPKGKENISNRFFLNETDVVGKVAGMKRGNKKLKRTKLDLGTGINEKNLTKEVTLSNDMLQTQIGIYEFHSVANKIVQNNLNN